MPLLKESITRSIDKARTPITKLKALFEWYDTWFESSEFRGCMLIKASEEFPDSNSTAKRASVEHKTWLTNVSHELLSQKKCRNACKLALYIMALLDGLTVSLNLNEPGNTNRVRDAWKFVHTLIKSYSKATRAHASSPASGKRDIGIH